MNAKRLMLRKWEKVCGTFRALKKDESGVTVQFDGFELCVFSGSKEAEIIENLLDDSLQGRRVSILKTDLTDRPLLIISERIERNKTIAETAVQRLAKIAVGVDVANEGDRGNIDANHGRGSGTCF